MNNFKNLYEIIKTLRFEARPKNEEASKKEGLDSNENIEIDDFIEQCKNIQEIFESIFIYEIDEKKDILKFQKKRKIKYGWLRIYTKNKFYN